MIKESIYNGTIERGTIIGTVNKDGDILIHMHIDDARILLTDVLDYEYVMDTVLPELKSREAVYDSIIAISVEKVVELQFQSDNCEKQNKNLNGILDNIRQIGSFKDLTIDNAEKAVASEKLKKGLAFGGGTLGGVGLGILIGFFLAK